MSQLITLEAILGLPDPPHASSGNTDVLVDKIHEHLDHLYEKMTDPELRQQVLRLWSHFQELQLSRECELDDRDNWGESWKRYAAPSVPVEHRVRFRLEQAAGPGDR